MPGREEGRGAAAGVQEAEKGIRHRFGLSSKGGGVESSVLSDEGFEEGLDETEGVIGEVVRNTDEYIIDWGIVEESEHGVRFT